MKLNLLRVPLRLGFEVFETGEIPQSKVDMMLSTMKAYRHLIEAYGIDHIKACATSAMRDATNSAAIIARIKEETGIEIDIISGEAEASFIYENHIAENMSGNGSYLYIDVGGGSTELTFFSNGKLNFKESFNIGTIRLLKNMVDESLWNAMRDYLKRHTARHSVTAIGSGGNINKVFSLSKRKEGKPLSLKLLKDYYKEMSVCTLEERRQVYNLREDRADVIVPALLIYINVMRWTGASQIYIPHIGLADGLIQHLYNEVTGSKK